MLVNLKVQKAFDIFQSRDSKLFVGEFLFLDSLHSDRENEDLISEEN